MNDYRAFLEAKKPAAAITGFPIEQSQVHEALRTGRHQHQAPIVQWGVRGGRRAYFLKFGLGKTYIEIETCRLMLEQLREEPAAISRVVPVSSRRGRRKALIVTPLGVRQEFLEAAEVLGVPMGFIRTTEEADVPDTIYLTNYESVRDGKIDPSAFQVVCLDEASVLRGLGTKTFREFYRKCIDVPYKFVATATPAPNEYIEILNYAMFLGVMDIGEAKTRFFRRDSERSDNLTLHPHKEREFWAWVHSWAVFLQRPSELGFSDEGYDLPPLQVNWHAVGVDHSTAGAERDGQGRLLHDAALGLKEAAAAKRSSLPERIAKVRELVDRRPGDHVIIWHDLEDERRQIQAEIRNVAAVYGSQDLEEREDIVAAFAHGEIDTLAAKPVMLGSGCNLQRHCHWAVFAGVGFKFNDFIQAIHRIYRFLQTSTVTIDIVYAESEAEVVKSLRAKWKGHDEMMERMSQMIRAFGLSSLEPVEQLTRSIGVERRGHSSVPAGKDLRWSWMAVNNDTVDETSRMESSTVGLVVTSIPFSTQYEYTPSYNDFGHTDSKAHFFEQMDFLTPEIYRVLEPGRVLAVHVKDRVRPGGYDDRGFQSIDFFHADCIQHYQKHGFVGAGMITVVTDVVRENSQTYRLTWSMQCEDGSRMGVGMPEYVLLFRKPPTDNTRGYADVPVEKPKSEYTKGRWQIEAHGHWRSSGNRLLGPEDFLGRPWPEVFQKFRQWTQSSVYDHEAVVAIAEGMDAAAQLPPDFMLLQPSTDHPDVWTDIMRARTLNGAQSAAGREKHLCPLQFDVVDRLIRRLSNPGDLVYDPFGGLGTVALQAVKAGRRGLTVELNPQYHDDAVRYLRAHDEKANTPTLFDLVEAEDGSEVGVP